MAEPAQQAAVDFVRLAGDEAGSAFFDRFLKDGSDAWDRSSRDLYPGLSSWKGVGPLKRSLRSLAGVPCDLPLLLANRSAQLVKFAARLLFYPCRNVLVTDLCWAPYREALAAEASRAGRALTTVQVREGVMERGEGAEQLAERVVAEAVRHGCDGVFLSAVSNLGYHLPVETIVRRIGECQELRFVVVDGAQDFCHVGTDLGSEYCDLYLAGCHKWLCAYHPMGLSFYGRRRSASMIETLLARLIALGEIDDPLLRFTSQMESGALDSVTETVNIAPLFSCQGAVNDALSGRAGRESRLATQLANLQTAADAARRTAWKPLLANPALRSGILLLKNPKGRTATAREIREAFAQQGVALTAYDGGVIRASMPAEPWDEDDLGLFVKALEQVS
jgi:hypothetical protein